MKTKPNAEVDRIVRLIMTAGGKGGVGKTLAAVGIIEYLKLHDVPVTIVDCDLENRKCGGISTYFPEAAKIDIRSERGLDQVLNHVHQATPQIALADLGAGSGHDTFKWFDVMADAVRELSIKVTLVAVITSDPAAIQTVFNWGYALRDNCDYLVVKNHKGLDDTFPYLDQTDEGRAFAAQAHPKFIKMEKRVQNIQDELNNRRLSVGQALNANLETRGRMLSGPFDLARLRGYQRNFNAELDSVKDLLLP